MAKLKSTLPNMLVVLGGIVAVASLLLAYVYMITEEPIKEVKIQKLNNAIGVVVPGLDSIKEYKVPVYGEDGNVIDSLVFYDVFKEKEQIGTAVKTYDNNGFSGLITVLVGFDNDGNIIKSLPLEQNETPGLGDKLDRGKSGFTLQFDGINPSKVNINVRKDGGGIDAITAATISSRAYCNAVRLAYDSYLINKQTNLIDKQTEEKGGDDESVE
ncbi:MAG: RnfABCDGE type electron transport complex subunit G [Bacteroidales bacterium]|jgi:electron transport complex protein RnfG|nr:RnfABCDGE type electron transport complex subunit G [Bacteroidales bacterium]